MSIALDVRSKTSKVSVLGFVLKFNSGVVFVRTPSDFRDAEMRTNVVVAGPPSGASGFLVIPDINIGTRQFY